MEKPKIGLSPEARALLEESGRGFFVTLRPDGSPTIHPMTALHSEGRLVYNTYRKSVKAKNATRDPRTCSLLFADYADAPDVALVYKGHARAVDPASYVPAAKPPTRPAREVAPTVGERVHARLQDGRRVLLGIDADEALILGPVGENGRGA